MIIGLGNDICNIGRIEQSYKKFGQHFIKRCFGKNEQKELQQIGDEKKFCSSLAKRFAAKEAFSKALGTGFRNGLAWAEIEILHEKDGRPYVCLCEKTEQLAKEKGAKKFFVSLSDDYPFAQAVVIIEG
ncbi:MAG: holo-ACP synthase [Alphaproteobacteria bacterium]|nr:holo-ACP synthase [Alphaproteobacteria bacterium]